MTVWQIVTGARGRIHTRDFLDYGLMYAGGPKAVNTLKQVKKGDLVILHEGRRTLVAAGEVSEELKEDQHAWFNDAEGWWPDHYCRVNWYVPESPVETTSMFGRGTISGCSKEDLWEAGREIIRSGKRLVSKPWPTGPIGEYTREEIITALTGPDMSVSDADALERAFDTIQRRVEYYYSNYDDCLDVSEHETVTFLVVPLLLALGWKEEQIKIEQPVRKVGRVDIACYSKDFTEKDAKCSMIVEAKGFANGMYYARKQAINYGMKIPFCERVVTTNGYCYKVYERMSDGGFTEDPVSYLSLKWPWKRYPHDPDNVSGAIETLQRLSPTWRPQVNEP